jgi:hypothetical protein
VSQPAPAGQVAFFDSWLQVTVVELGTVVVPVSMNDTGLPVKPAEEAVTVFVPAVAPNVRFVEASPVLSVVAVVALSVPPPAVTAKVTGAPETPLPFTSDTLTAKGAGSGCPGAAVWAFPLVITRFAADPVVVLAVAVNVIGLPARVPEFAVTVFAPAVLPRVSVLDA